MIAIICGGKKIKTQKTSAKENQTALSSFLSFLQMKNQILNYTGEGFSQQFQHHENKSHHS